MELDDSRLELRQIGKLAQENIENLCNMVSRFIVEKLEAYCYDIISQIKSEVDSVCAVNTRAVVDSASLSLTDQVKRLVQPILGYQQQAEGYRFEGRLLPLPRPSVPPPKPPPPPPPPPPSQPVHHQPPPKPPQKKPETEKKKDTPKEKSKPRKPPQPPQAPPPLLPNGQIPRQMCHICYQKFNNGIHLSNHLTEVHSVVPKERVPPPVKDYPLYSKLLKDDLTYTCTYCKDVLRGPFQTYRMHLNQEHNRNQWFVCLDCPSAFENAFDLSRHVFGAHSTRLHMQRFIYRCKATRKEFVSVKWFQLHLVDIMAYHRQVPDGYEKYMIRQK